MLYKNFNLKIAGPILIISVLYLTSCRSADIDQNETLIGSGRGIGAVAVKINLLGTEYANSDKPAKVASINQKGLNIDNSVQHYSVLVTPSSFISAELAPVTTLNTVASTSKLNSMAAVPGTPIGTGVKFRVIAYKQSDGTYSSHQEYTIGQPAQPMMLDSGKAYDMIVYSYGVNTLPAISANEQNNISSAKVNYDDTNRDFMYQKISYTPDGNNPNNTLNITLMHKIAQITTIVNSSSLGNITDITGGVLTPHYSDGVISLASGTMSGRTKSSSGAVLNFSGLNTTTSTSTPVFVNADTGGNATGGFSAAMTIAGTTKTINLPNSFKIIPENKSNLTINLFKCGAYIGPNTDPANFKEFMCYNLGADTSVNAFTPSAAIHGAKYQWGAQTGETGRYISQADDQSNSGSISGWISTPKPYGSWIDSSKTGNDPCPSGYRVPTIDQWKTVINNNNIEKVGSWAEDGNYTTALYFRSPSNIRTLMLPAAGSRSKSDGTLNDRGNEGLYWSSSEASSIANVLYFNSNSVFVFNYNPSDGFPVRCVAE
ncbi:fibrobacter succinogenes major paralogous domain-containing protein [Elizabethkingia meningoseptica]|uniref:FISUMP domain-containing protein n=1 Tax=Elizabethkingia meningoseptica TaxID=238 RepID=UPI0023AFD5A8|nr:FISUMP domain-containing protein [Elizabethkingia meningoseptica]MDE5483492.1 fibrobacter succinogenes major paralogous domain-containing protein [Elizabethkingia meningoseptica]